MLLYICKATYFYDCLRVFAQNYFAMYLGFGRAASAGFACLASGYPLHHLRALLRTSGAAVGRFGGSATIPLAARPSGASPLRGRMKQRRLNLEAKIIIFNTLKLNN